MAHVFWPRRLRAYRLQPANAEAERPTFVCECTARDERYPIFLPHVAGAYFLVLPNLGGQRFSLSVQGLDVVEFGVLAALWLRLRSWFLRARFVLRFRDFQIVIGGTKASRRLLGRTVDLLSRLCTPLDGAALPQHPELILGWGPTGVSIPQSEPVLRRSALRCAVVLHLFYADLWPEIGAVLKSLPSDFDLIVTTVGEREALATQILSDFPDARIFAMENRGRDIRPFLTLVEQGILDGYDAVCKIHGKKSLHGVNRNPYGEFGRRRMIFDLLCGNQAMARALRRFDVSPTLGLLGPEYFRVAGTGTLRFFWRKNRQRVAEVLRLFGISADDVKPDFFAGSMFWVRPKCLLEFKQLGLSTQFGDERGNTDGTLEHAIERSLTNIVLHAGYEIDVIDGLATR